MFGREPQPPARLSIRVSIHGFRPDTGVLFARASDSAGRRRHVSTGARSRITAGVSAQGEFSGILVGRTVPSSRAV